MNQQIIIGNGDFEKLKSIIESDDSNRYMLIHSPSLLRLESIYSALSSSKSIAASFGRVKPNPEYETVQEALASFKASDCNALIAVGGGSAIDVAKAVRYYFEETEQQTVKEFIAIPTTAGTGSESTCFAVMYKDHGKVSLDAPSLLPSIAYLDGTLLNSLPVYQKKCTMLDALCQCIESIWSVNSTPESIEYAETGAKLLLDNLDAYVAGETSANADMLLGANYSGRAICISKTTAAHAMSYKITSTYNLPHGHAVAICLPHVWRFIVDHPSKCTDSRGQEHLQKQLGIIDRLFGCDNAIDAIKAFSSILNKLDITPPILENDEALNLLVGAVNVERLKNTPVDMDKTDLKHIYSNVFKTKTTI